MLRTISEVIQRPDGRFKMRFNCGHISDLTLKKPPQMDRMYECQRCEFKGQGTKAAGIGYLNNGGHK